MVVLEDGLVRLIGGLLGGKVREGLWRVVRWKGEGGVMEDC